MWVLFPALALLVAAMATAPPKAAMKPARQWVHQVLAAVSRSEGTYDSLNLNADGAGLSVGIIQWAQKPGQLGVLLAAMYRADPAQFARSFGGRWAELLKATKGPGVRPVGGVDLWREPWVSRFTAALQLPAFRRVQDRLATQGTHFQGALDVARALNIATPRALAMFYDQSVQQGPAAALRIAEAVRQQLGSAATYEQILSAWSKEAARRFRRTTPPTRAFPAAHIEWRKTGTAWHAWAGSFDLYTAITNRQRRLRADERLSDRSVTLPARGGMA